MNCTVRDLRRKSGKLRWSDYTDGSCGDLKGTKDSTLRTGRIYVSVKDDSVDVEDVSDRGRTSF